MGVLIIYFILAVVCLLLCDDFESFLGLLLFGGMLVTLSLWAAGAFNDGSNEKPHKDTPVEKSLKEGYQE